MDVESTEAVAAEGEVEEAASNMKNRSLEKNQRPWLWPKRSRWRPMTGSPCSPVKNLKIMRSNPKNRKRKNASLNKKEHTKKKLWNLSKKKRKRRVSQKRRVQRKKTSQIRKPKMRKKRMKWKKKKRKRSHPNLNWMILTPWNHSGKTRVKTWTRNQR